MAKTGKRCGDCRFLEQSPAEIEQRQPNGTDYDLPCRRFGQREEFRACTAFERREKGHPVA
ncbi:MAG: hypothetical protein ACM3YO_07930 [Bacteroidota bacterium]